MKQHLTLSNVLILVLIVGQAYLMYKINKKDDLPMLEAAERIVGQNDSIMSDNAELKAILRAERGLHNDTIRLIEHQRTVNYNQYVQNVNRVFTADSGAQFTMYRNNSRRFDSTFYSGQFTSK